MCKSFRVFSVAMAQLPDQPNSGLNRNVPDVLVLKVRRFTVGN